MLPAVSPRIVHTASHSEFTEQNSAGVSGQYVVVQALEKYIKTSNNVPSGKSHLIPKC